MKKRIIDFNNPLTCYKLAWYIHDPALLTLAQTFCPFNNSVDMDGMIFMWRKEEEEEEEEEENNFWERWEKYKFEKLERTEEINNFINNELSGLPASSTNPATIETYNAFARYDEWPGGYVQGYGYISIESSNSTTYGQPMIMGTSWVYKGISEVPVTKGRFYSLVLNSQWHGGFVDNYGYMGDLQQVLGSTGAEQLVQVYPGYGTIGSIVNASLMLDHAVTQSQVYEDMNGTTISDDGLQQLLQNYFPASSPAIYDDIEEALDDQCVIIARVNMNLYNTNIPNHVGDGDYNVVDYNPVKHRYVCFDSVSKQIKVLDKDLVDNGTISARFYIMNRV